MEYKDLLVLFKNGEYAKVLECTKNSSKIDDLFLRAISFALNQEYKNAINTLVKNEDILSTQLAKLIDVHMEICFWANEFIDAQKALEHYEEYPYESQEVEEKFTQYKKEIEKQIKGASKNFYSEEDIEKLLVSKNPNDVEIALSHLKKYDVTPYLNSIQKLLVSKLESSVRCLGLILLYEKKINSLIKYNWNGEIIEVNPSSLKTPFQDKKFISLLERKSEMKDVAYGSTFETILATYYLYMYPKSVENSEEDLFAAVDIVTRKYMDMPQNKMRQKPEVEALIKDIEKANQAF